MMRVFQAAVAGVLFLCLTNSTSAQDTTDVVILGVSHSAMLVAESYQPGVLRAYIDRVAPDAICIERPPEKFAQGSHYEFTYEIQDLAVPYARERGIALCPFDWMPSSDDQQLAFGVDLEVLPLLRGPTSYANFLSFPDTGALTRDLFYAEDATERAGYREWYETMAERPRRDFARRLFLYRTFMQAMRIARAAREHAGGRLLVLVGSMHKEDLERILGDQPGVRVIAPVQFGRPTSVEVANHTRTKDRAAIATFNLLGVQSSTGNVDWQWLDRVVGMLEAELPRPEVELFRVRLGVLTGALSPSQAAERYRRIRELPGAAARFTWDGVRNRGRVDSFFDPFGNLTVGQRAAVEEARELARLGKSEDVERLERELKSELSPGMSAQLDGYWNQWILGAR